MEGNRRYVVLHFMSPIQFNVGVADDLGVSSSNGGIFFP